jgi:hypothetical protein
MRVNIQLLEENKEHRKEEVNYPDWKEMHDTTLTNSIRNCIDSIIDSSKSDKVKDYWCEQLKHCAFTEEAVIDLVIRLRRAGFNI